MPQIILRDHENFEGALRRFKKSVDKTGLIPESRARRSFVSNSKKRKERLQAAKKRLRRNLRANQFPKQYKGTHQSSKVRKMITGSDNSTVGSQTSI